MEAKSPKSTKFWLLIIGAVLVVAVAGLLVIQSLRENKYIALQNISKICELLDCQPADLLEYQKEE